MELLRKMNARSDQPAIKMCVNKKDLPSAKLAVGGGVSLQGGRVRGASSASIQDKSVPATDKCQLQWRPPPMVDPVEDVEEMEDEETVVDLGVIDSGDAAVYSVREKKDGQMRDHCLLKIPSKLPTISKRPCQSASVFNLVMVDVSGSMTKWWDVVQDGWNSNMAPLLSGRSTIYTFGSSVIFRRSGTMLERNDFDAGGTDLTGALQTVINEVYQCRERFVNVFIITDGDHNSTGVEPSSVIDQMHSPRNKVCDVYILGIGNDFPVQYSLDIRSRLHNGTSNVPSLFWSKEVEDTVGQMTDISHKLSEGHSYKVKLTMGGSLLPGLPVKNTFHLGEWVYFPSQPDQFNNVKITFKGHSVVLVLEPKEASFSILEEVFHQWNSIIFQRHRNSESLPEDVLDFKERLFKTQMEIIDNGSNSIRNRLERKALKANEMNFRKEFSQLRSLLTNQKFEDQLELAEAVLSTTVTKSKYLTRSLQLKGYSDIEFEKDRESFIQVFNEYFPYIQNLAVTPEECCRVTMTSTISDLQDPGFVEMLRGCDKYTFLKTFAITGIPVFSPTRDSVVLNPWSFSVRSMLKSPYTVMSQTAMEAYGEIEEPEGPHKIIQLKQGDDSTRYNAVVPVFPPSVAKAMRPFVKTRLYAMCVTFATLKNPYVIDFEIPMASLAVTWVRCLYENPSQPRPEHVRVRMESIEATANLYMDLQRYANYCKVLVEDPPQALMTESKILVENKPVKSESLIKPMFFLNMMNKHSPLWNFIDVKKVMSLLLMEYIGRCLSSYKSSDSENTPYCDFFAEFLNDQDRRKDWVTRNIAEIRKDVSGNETTLLENYYTLEKVTSTAKKIANEQAQSLKEELTTKIPLKANMGKIEQLRNLSATGDVSWFTLKAFAKEIGLGKEEINHLFSKESLFVYTAHALQYRSSRERLSKPLASYDTSVKIVSKKVQEESSLDVIDIFCKEIVSTMERAWLKAYFDIHSEVVKPMTRKEVINAAQRIGIEVTAETFDQVYKNFRPSGLLSNACQTKACPYYLHPHKSYNQHASVERTKGKVFVHGLHKVAQLLQERDLTTIVQEIALGKYTKRNHTIPEHAVKNLTQDIHQLQLIYKEIDHHN